MPQNLQQDMRTKSSRKRNAAATSVPPEARQELEAYVALDEGSVGSFPHTNAPLLRDRLCSKIEYAGGFPRLKLPQFSSVTPTHCAKKLEHENQANPALSAAKQRHPASSPTTSVNSSHSAGRLRLQPISNIKSQVAGSSPHGPEYFISSIPSAAGLLDCELFPLPPTRKNRPESAKKISLLFEKLKQSPKDADQKSDSILKFVYMRPTFYPQATPAQLVNRSPYDLEIVDYELVDKSNFYTISAAGVTHFCNGHSEFTTLESWIRDRRLYDLIKKIPFFSKYRSWKAFSTWRNNVRRASFNASRSKLLENAFYISPITAQGLLAVQLAAHNTICEKSFFRVPIVNSTPNLPGNIPRLDNNVANSPGSHPHGKLETWTLSELLEIQSQNINASQKLLQDYDTSLRQAVTDTCKQALIAAKCDSLPPPPPPRQQQVSLIKEHAKPSYPRISHSNTASSNNLYYTIQAARQTECVRLQRFVKLVDYLRLHSLHMFIVESVRTFLLLLLARVNIESTSPNMSENAQKDACDTKYLLLDCFDSVLLARAGYNPFAPVMKPFVSRSADIAANAAVAYLEPIASRKNPLFYLQSLLDCPKNSLGLPESNGNVTAVIRIAPTFNELIAFCDKLVATYISVVESLPPLINSIPDIESAHSYGANTYSVVPSIVALLGDNVYFKVLLERVKLLLTINYEKAKAFAASFSFFRDMFSSNSSLDFSCIDFSLSNCEMRLCTPDFSKDPPEPYMQLESKRSVDFVEDCLTLFSKQIEKVQEIPTHIEIENFLIDLVAFKDKLLPPPQRCFNDIAAIIPIIAKDKNEYILNEINDSIKVLSSQPASVETFVKNLQRLDKVQSLMSEYDDQAEQVNKLYSLISKYAIPIPPTDFAMFQTLAPSMRQIKDSVELNNELREENVAKFSVDLDQNFKELLDKIVDIRNQIQDPMVTNPNAPVEDVLSFLNDINSRFSELVKTREIYESYQELFKVPHTKTVEIAETGTEIELRLTLWQCFKDWDALTTTWDNSPFESLVPDEMSTKINHYLKVVYNVEKGMPPNDVVPRLRALVEAQRAIFSSIVDLRNPALKSRHWDRIQENIGSPIVRDQSLTLASLKAANVFRFRDEIATVSSQASSEASLEEMLQKIVRSWTDTDFCVLPYRDAKDVFIIGAVEDIQALLEDSLMTLATIKASRYIAPIRNDVEKWDRLLSLFANTLDAWTICQRNWLYLESIFQAPDIQRQLPEESKMFSMVDRNWKDIMRRTSRHPNALKAGTMPGTLETLQENNQLLDKIQKCIEDYLESKRLLFPRFYFLSNDELLEILSQTRNPQSVQPHLAKCFDAIKSLEFTIEAKSNDIVAMVSPEGERVPFLKPVKARGNIEAWLGSVEESMVSTIRKLLKIALADYQPEARTRWLLDHIGQVILTASQILWCATVSKCLSSSNSLDDLKRFRQQCIVNLTQLASIVRGDLKKLQRAVLGALITIDVHARDILSEMIAAQVEQVTDFGWLKQLRYYWDADADSCTVKMSDTSFPYGYEYLGCSPRLVITPLTDRCYLTLTGAISINLGGSPLGPAGTGKTETVKDLAKALARQCVVFNCSDALDYKMMGKFFAGLAQSGAWCCFDEFNRIDIEVLSVVAQQLLSIKQAKDSQVSRFMFEGKEIRLIASCAAFITMNPGYAGRQELPDNLKAMFRPIAMMIPDYGLIAEIMLYSEGFEDAKMLAGKVVTMYKLCSEQLSQQDHYDFGMRAVKSVLVMAGQLKRANPNISENIVLIRSLRDSNLPKFLSDDIPLFLGILQDLFPGIVIPDQDFGALKSEVVRALENHRYVPVDRLVDRIIQLYDTTRVRHGVMLVGPPCGGKTVAYQILAKALTSLSASKIGDFAAVQMSVLNPKCITMDELYGAVNLATMEWKDGLIGKITRQQVSDPTNDEKWTVFDGPVDALWIENMNTVLDDNKLLCLANGERIKLSPCIRMLFEVMDLAVASPATVSRCGMVYMDPANLGWRPYVTKWLAELPEKFGTELRDVLQNLFDIFVDRGLKFIKDQRQLIAAIEASLVMSLCNLLLTLIHEYDWLGRASLSDKKNVLMTSFIFCYTWSIGGSIHESCYDAFDTFARELFESGPTVECAIPHGGTLYSYFVDTKQRVFVPWEEIMPKFDYLSSTPYFEIVVPTVDTMRFQFLVDQLLQFNRPCLFVGCTGVGKSVIMQDYLLRKGKQRGYIPVLLNFSAQTTSAMTQSYIELKAERKKRGGICAPPGKKIVIFVDDLNLPKPDTYGSQPPIELLRQFVYMKGFYETEKLVWKDAEDIMLVSACAPPGGGRSAVTPRLLRHFNTFNIPLPSDTSLSRIFRTILDGFLKPFSVEVKSAAESTVKSAIELYNQLCVDFLPTPAKSHYTFNVRDLSKVFQGLTQLKPSSITQRSQMVACFAHEASRIFHDRLIDAKDRDRFSQMLSEIIDRNFSEALVKSKPILFGDFSKRGVPHDERVYTQFEDPTILEALFEDYLEEYNVTLSKDMRLIFFSDAQQHIIRLLRIIRQPRGNALLIGVGGTGKKSLTRLACHISEYQCLEIELTRSYGKAEWREDIKKLYRKTGVEGKNTVFLLTDSQIKTEEFLEDINGILNSGDIPSLFDVEERETIIADLRKLAVDKGYSEDRDSVYQFFINRARDYLHIVFGTSPVGETFRNRCRMFPSLVNCCTIDWYDEWPTDALLSVSKRFFQFKDFGGDESMREKLAQLCVNVHTSVSETALKFYAELKRRIYTTPTSYLELITLYLSMLQEKRKDFGASCDRLKNGLLKLAETNDVVANMQQTLRQLEPELQKKAHDVEELMVKIAKDQEIADGVRKTVSEEEKIVKQQAEQTEAIAQEAKRDLDEALPALDAAYKALDSLEKKDVSEMKAFAKPPELVVLVMEAVCVLFRVKPDWDTSKKLLGDPQFLKKIQDYDKSKLDEAIVKKLKKYIDNPLFNPEAVEKVSKAAKSVAMWVIAMDIFCRISKEVEPKRKKLTEAQASLEQTKAQLAAKTAQLQDIEDQLRRLKNEYEESLTSKRSLSDKMDITKKRLERANKLTAALADEQERWTASVGVLEQQMQQLVGNVFIGSACIAYFGAFNNAYRRSLVSTWIQNCLELGIPVATEFSLTEQLGDPVQIREWKVQGLPGDELSTENAILVTKGRRWPLMIDPQGQANSWIRNMYPQAELSIVKLTEPRFLRTIENAIRTGQAVLIEDVGETLDPSLEPLLLKQTVRQGGRQLLKLGDTNVEYDQNFKLFITTKLANPHYLPEVCIKVTLINFMVTRDGLEGQLLADVVKLERHELEEQRNNLVSSIAADKHQLKDIEEKILRLLYNSQGNILDDEELIKALNQSKVTSAAITERLVLAEQTEREINAARERYRPVALRGSLLYFVVVDLGEIDQMYQFSLKYFKRLFCGCIEESPKDQDLQEHIEYLCEEVALVVFSNVARGLFEQHKAIFSFMICVSIQLERGKIRPNEWNFFIRGAIGSVKEDDASRQLEKPQIRCITEAMWRNCCLLALAIEDFNGLPASILSDSLEWEIYMDSEEVGLEAPGYRGGIITEFQQLLLTKIFREQKLVPSVMRYVKNSIGTKYVEVPPLDLGNVFKDMSPTIPLVFVLSSGSDPNAGFMKLANSHGKQNKMHLISLGQGQGPIADSLIQKATLSGEWVFLQNCHLAASWMPRLEAIVKDILSGETKVDTDFRLFLSSMPSKAFPVSILQESIKLTNEPPKGLRANLMRSFADINADSFDSLGAGYRKLVYSLCFFNAVVHERKKFGPLGWNILYDWSNSDLEVSIMILQRYMREGASSNQKDKGGIPWDALRYMIGEIAFGGRVTDEWDRRTLRTLLASFYDPRVLQDNCTLSPSGRYIVPPDEDLHAYRGYIDLLPFVDDPSVFGMHPNADVCYQMQESQRMIQTVLDVQPRLLAAGGGTGKSPEGIVGELSKSILEKIPEAMVPELTASFPGRRANKSARSSRSRKESVDNGSSNAENKISEEMFKTDKGGRMINALSTVLCQECMRYNRLTAVIKYTLMCLEKAIRGELVMSADLERVFGDLLLNRVPAAWASKAYPSLKPLGSWFKDLLARIGMLRSWLENGQPQVFWIPGFFFPQGFLTGVFQNHSRRHNAPIDSLQFRFEVLSTLDLDFKPDTDMWEMQGVIVGGLFLEGARWDIQKGRLEDAFPMEMYTRMPLINLIPELKSNELATGKNGGDSSGEVSAYVCPLYKTSQRAGTLSTTGHSTNFVCPVSLRTTKHAPNYWTLRGVALLMQLND